jgi:hypothetical protein
MENIILQGRQNASSGRQALGRLIFEKVNEQAESGNFNSHKVNVNPEQAVLQQCPFCLEWQGPVCGRRPAEITCVV